MSNRKTRADSLIDSLTTAQQEVVFSHCETTSLEAGADWLRAEYDVTISPQRLGKWLEKRRADFNFVKTLASIRADADRAKLINNTLSGSGFTTAASTMIGQVIFEELRKPVTERNEDRIVNLMGHALKARDQELKSQQNDLLLARFRRDTCELFIKWSADEKAREVLKSGTSNAEKIEALGAAMFGEEWNT
jgi:hypothetical protein